VAARSRLANPDQRLPLPVFVVEPDDEGDVDELARSLAVGVL
jgi:hypothetical protein